jgi:hypothetical protein
MEQPNSKFPTMGTSAASNVKNASGKPLTGKLVKKKNTAAGDPYAQAKPSRPQKQVTSARTYGITTKMPSYVDPQIGPTQGNGRLFKAATNRTLPNFTDGMSSHN